MERKSLALTLVLYNARHLLRLQQITSRNHYIHLPTYLTWFNGYDSADMALHYGSMLRECKRHQVVSRQAEWMRELLERKRLKKLRQGEQKAKIQANDEVDLHKDSADTSDGATSSASKLDSTR